MRVAQLILILAAGLVVAGCKTKPATLPDASNPEETTVAETGADEDSGVSGRDLSADQLALQEAQRAGNIVYFDYDRAEIKPEYVAVVAAHAKYLNGGSGRSVRLEGPSDERGTAEYTLALGNRRATAARRRQSPLAPFDNQRVCSGHFQRADDNQLSHAVLVAGLGGLHQ